MERLILIVILAGNLLFFSSLGNYGFLQFHRIFAQPPTAGAASCAEDFAFHNGCHPCPSEPEFIHGLCEIGKEANDKAYQQILKSQQDAKRTGQELDQKLQSLAHKEKSEVPITGCESYSGSQYDDCIKSQLDESLKGVKDPCGDPSGSNYVKCILGEKKKNKPDSTPSPSKDTKPCWDPSFGPGCYGPQDCTKDMYEPCIEQPKSNQGQDDFDDDDDLVPNSQHYNTLDDEDYPDWIDCLLYPHCKPPSHSKPMLIPTLTP